MNVIDPADVANFAIGSRRTAKIHTGSRNDFRRRGTKVPFQFPGGEENKAQKLFQSVLSRMVAIGGFNFETYQGITAVCSGLLNRR